MALTRAPDDTVDVHRVGPASQAAPHAKTKRSVPLVVAVPLLVAVLLVAAGVGVAVGPVGVDLPTVAQIVAHHIAGSAVPHHYGEIDNQIVWQLRLPRVLLAVVVGSGLAVVGTTLQAVVRNPLADPYLLGVSNGAGLLAAAIITLGSAAVAGLSSAMAAFLGSVLATVLVLAISVGDGRFAPTRVVLAGVTLSFLFSGLTNFLIFHSGNPNAAESVLFWLLGSLDSAAWSNLGMPALVVATGSAYLLIHARSLNALVMGDEAALSVGITVKALRARLLLITALVTGAMVAQAGGIAFVGLIIPHTVRLLVGPDHRRVIPTSALVGAIFLVVVDAISRVAVSPGELPIGIITSTLGAPVFLVLLRRSRAGALSR